SNRRSRGQRQQPHASPAAQGRATSQGLALTSIRLSARFPSGGLTTSLLVRDWRSLLRSRWRIQRCRTATTSRVKACERGVPTRRNESAAPSPAASEDSRAQSCPCAALDICSTFCDSLRLSLWRDSSQPKADTRREKILLA